MCYTHDHGGRSLLELQGRNSGDGRTLTARLFSRTLSGATTASATRRYAGALGTLARQPILLVIVITTLLRLATAAATGLGVDESYMVGNARFFSWSYVDHPPLHIWMAAAVMRIFGSEAAIVVRLPFILLFAASTWFMFALTRQLFGRQAGFWAALAFNLAPVFSVGHGIYVLPDGPLIFFLLVSANILAAILFGFPERQPIISWMMAGGAAGLALLSKYSAVFFIASVFAYLLTEPGGRRWLRTPGPWLAVLVSAFLFAPALAWNVEHNLAGFTFQAGRVAPSQENPLRLIGESFGGQAGYLTPWLLVSLAAALFRALAQGPRDRKAWFLALLAIGPVAFFTLLSFRAKVLPHWPMPGWLFVFPLFGEVAARGASARPLLFKRLAACWAAALLFVATAATLQAAGLGIRQETLRALGLADPTIDLLDWSGLRQAFASRGLLTADLVVGAPDWITAGKASYALGPSVPVLCLCGDPHHFPFRANPANFGGRDIILVGRSAGMRDGLARYFGSIQPMSPISVERRGEPVLTLGVAVGHGLFAIK
jgi:4-amino-4-deoxy-L-arabinose transferase-like glycosyltransferase